MRARSFVYTAAPQECRTERTARCCRMAWAISGRAVWSTSCASLATPASLKVIDPPHAVLASRLRRLTLSLDPMGRVATRTSLGLAFWDGRAWREFGPDNGLPDHPITAALADPDGNFWLAVNGHRSVPMAWL
ncbi:MAG: hypothetical protein WDM77_12880 [Steroidobacteraceae bacterium]